MSDYRESFDRIGSSDSQRSSENQRYSDNFRGAEKEPNRAFKKIERLVRLVALLFLCGLVWWFSYDHGRSSVRGRLYRMEAENISLRERVIILENDLAYYKDKLKQAEAKLAPDHSRRGEEVKPKEAAEGEKDKNLSPSDNQSRGRLTVRLSENKSVFEDKAVVSLVELNSLDMEAIVRISHNDTGRREAMTMKPGDIFEVAVEGGKHSLYLDQIKGSLAFFIIDGYPGEK